MKIVIPLNKCIPIQVYKHHFLMGWNITLNISATYIKIMPEQMVMPFSSLGQCCSSPRVSW